MITMKVLGLTNTVNAHKTFLYLLYYDIDTDKYPYTVSEILDKVKAIHQLHYYDYLIYSTKHGYHFICLNSMNLMTYAKLFTLLKYTFKGYYSGIAIRLSFKKREVQQLIATHIVNKYSIVHDLYYIYAHRFNLPYLPYRYNNHKLIFIRYDTSKE